MPFEDTRMEIWGAESMLVVNLEISAWRYRDAGQPRGLFVWIMTIQCVPVIGLCNRGPWVPVKEKAPTISYGIPWDVGNSSLEGDV